jgi:hypothetical protein
MACGGTTHDRPPGGVRRLDSNSRLIARLPQSPAAPSAPGVTANDRRSAPLDSIYLLYTGAYDRGRVRAQTGENWLALYKIGTTWRLDSVRITVDSTRTPCGVGFGDMGNSPVVSINAGDAPKLLIRGASGLRAGPVQTLSLPDGHVWPGQDSRPLVIGAEVWELKAYGTAMDRPVQNYRLELWSRTGSSQVIFGPVSAYYPPDALWTGDLDNDGKVDVLIDPSVGGEEPVTPELWLSSLATGTELVHRVTGPRTIYCD